MKSKGRDLFHTVCNNDCCVFEPVSEYVDAFDEIINGPVAEYLSLSQKIGGDVQKHVSRCVQK